MQPKIQEISGSGVTWTNVTKIGKPEMNELRKRFKFLDIDLNSCLPPNQRPNFNERDKYLFISLTYPQLEESTKKIIPVELDLFITKKNIVTIHNGKLKATFDLGELLIKKRDEHKHILLNPAELLYHILNRLINDSLITLSKISSEIDSIENNLSVVTKKETIDKIFRIKNNIIEFKKWMRPHTVITKKMLTAVPKFFHTGKLNNYFQELVEHTQEINDRLESDSDTINAIEDSHMSLLNLRNSDIMRIVTLFAVIVFPLTLVAGIFGMNTLHAPIIGDPNDFWIIIALMSAGTLAMLAYFKSKRWL